MSLLVNRSRPAAQGSTHCINRGGAGQFHSLAREMFSHCSMAGTGAYPPGVYPKRELAPEPLGQSRNEAVSIGLVVEDVG